MNLSKEFVPYKQSLEIKLLGFDEPCLAWATLEYANTIHVGNGYKVHRETDLPTKPFGIPTFSQAFRFFREKYNLKVSFPYWNGFNGMIPDRMQYKYECVIVPENDKSITVRENGRVYFDTYEEAELACLFKLISIVKEK
jgi:hypothetical protein